MSDDPYENIPGRHRFGLGDDEGGEMIPLTDTEAGLIGAGVIALVILDCWLVWMLCRTLWLAITTTPDV